MRRAGITGVALALLVATGGCSDQQEKYCSALQDEKQTLSSLSARADDPRSGSLAETIDVFERLRDQAPEDVADEWDTYVTAWQALESAMKRAGADESMFRDGRKPPGMSQEKYDAISAAAADLRSTRVVSAASGIQRQALDVCKVDLGGAGLSP